MLSFPIHPSASTMNVTPNRSTGSGTESIRGCGAVWLMDNGRSTAARSSLFDHSEPCHHPQVRASLQLTLVTTDTYTASTSQEPPRKKSKWAEQADEEDRKLANDKKRAKKDELLRSKLLREREQLDMNSREGTPRGVGSPRPRQGARGPRPIRDMHPPLQSCRSVYCYEVRWMGWNARS